MIEGPQRPQGVVTGIAEQPDVAVFLREGDQIGHSGERPGFVTRQIIEYRHPQFVFEHGAGLLGVPCGEELSPIGEITAEDAEVHAPGEDFARGEIGTVEHV